MGEAVPLGCLVVSARLDRPWSEFPVRAAFTPQNGTELHEFRAKSVGRACWRARCSGRGTTMKVFLAFAPVLVGLMIGCAAVPDDEGDQGGQALSSNERTLLFAKDDASRVWCRDVTNRYYCSEEEASAAATACAIRLSPVPAKLAAEKVPGACSKSSELYPTIESCKEPMPEHCGFYAACLERAIPCGEQGYALGFGEKYCTAFRNAEMSERGNRWAMGVMGCLQRALVDRIERDGTFDDSKRAASGNQQSLCKDVFDEAFDSHPGCYTRAEDSFCYLPLRDVYDVAKVIGVKELMTSRTRAQMTETVRICLGQFARKIMGTSGSERRELEERTKKFEDLEREYAQE